MGESTFQGPWRFSPWRCCFQQRNEHKGYYNRNMLKIMSFITEKSYKYWTFGVLFPQILSSVVGRVEASSVHYETFSRYYYRGGNYSLSGRLVKGTINKTALTLRQPLEIVFIQIRIHFVFCGFNFHIWRLGNLMKIKNCVVLTRQKVTCENNSLKRFCSQEGKPFY